MLLQKSSFGGKFIPPKFKLIFSRTRKLGKERIITKPIMTARKSATRVFPLHVTSFEHYMFVDDRDRYPMSFIVQLEFSGDINRELFEESILQALQRHPLLQATIGPAKQGKDCWVSAPNKTPVIDWGKLNEPIEFENGERIDLREEIGVRFFIRHDEHQAIVTTQFHHSTCDGIGSYQFLGDVLFEYAIRTGDAHLQPPEELEPKKLRGRGKASYDMNNFRLPNGKYQRTWDEALRLLVRNNIVLRSPERKPAEFRCPFPGIESYTFDKQQFKSLRLAAQGQGQIVNDLLVEKLFQTLHDWHDKLPGRPWRRHVAIMMPMNLRESEDQALSACNVVAHAFVRRKRSDLNDIATFRKRLSNELLQLKHHRKEIRFMHMLAGGHYFYPKTLKASLDWKRNLATAILSNTGDPTKQFYAQLPREGSVVRCGNLKLEDISGVPPIRPGTSTTVSIFTYRRELKICLRCDPNKFSEAETRQLLDLYVHNIEQII